MNQLERDIDIMRDVYMSRTQREAYERIRALAAQSATPIDPQLAAFYQVNTTGELLAAQEEHIHKLQDAARRNVKPWEDTFPPTLLPKYLRDTGLAQTAQSAVLSVPERPNAEWYRRKIMEGADDAPGVIGAGFVYVCSNPSALHQHFLDPKGHCPQCIREGLGNWSCVAATPAHDQPEGSDNE